MAIESCSRAFLLVAATLTAGHGLAQVPTGSSSEPATTGAMSSGDPTKPPSAKRIDPIVAPVKRVAPKTPRAKAAATKAPVAKTDTAAGKAGRTGSGKAEQGAAASPACANGETWSPKLKKCAKAPAKEKPAA